MPSLKPLKNLKSAKRGDTIIEVMFALAIFALVTVLSIMAMDGGLVTAEGALEQVTTRNELNAQAEALRFVHSSYIAEKTLPIDRNSAGAGNRYQQYRPLWQQIVANAITPSDANAYGILDLSNIVTSTDPASSAKGCARLYDMSRGYSILYNSHAFVLNTRNLSSLNNAGQIDVGVSYISTRDHVLDNTFTTSPLNARIIFGSPTASTESDEQLSDLVIHDQVKRAEGIWIVAVTDGTSASQTKYYDFYIQSCWNDPSNPTPTTIDTVIRLSNPENI